MQLLIATSNRGKQAEIAHEVQALHEADVQVLGLADVPGLPGAVEDLPTFIGNAVKKARHYAMCSGLPALADDSGLCVAALGGAPGVHSARYAGEPSNDQANNGKLLRVMEHVPEAQRQAAFVCAMALATPMGLVALVQRRMEGILLHEPRGANGFGYDPLFLVAQAGKTTAELTMAEKSLISHRGKALRAIMPWLRQYLVAGEASPRF